MKQLIIFSCLAFLPHILFSQKKISPVVSLSNTNSIGNSYYNNIILSSGVRLNIKTGYFDIKGAYQLSGARTLRSHQLGMEIEYRILSAQKRFSPFVSLNGFTEVETNYRDKYLNSESFGPSSQHESSTTNSNSHGYTIFTYTTNFSQFYYATPFVGSISAGLDVRLVEGLHLNFSLGFGMRLLQTRYYSWSSDNELNIDALQSKEIQNNYLKMFNTKLGINYAIYKRDSETTAKSKMLLGLQHSTSFGDNLYLNTGAFLGVTIDKAILKLGYQLSGTNSYNFQSHQIGAGLEYTFLSPEKRFRPYFEMNGYTEVGSNYRNQYMKDLTPVDGPSFYGMNQTSNGLMKMSYQSSFYRSTPFVGNILAGVNIRLVDNLHLNVACGVGFRTVHTMYNVWRENIEMTDEIIDSSVARYNTLKLFDVKVGLNYLLSKKSNK